ncbi:hypothetical protein [Streptomyces sp. NPDC093707]|uniref:hypothetical protein n=1 Tax=Streptomyces sp. NPDC093707 TaxID=3154984 RepID=UPI00344BC32F
MTPCICGAVLVVVARFRAAAVLRLENWLSSALPDSVSPAIVTNVTHLVEAAARYAGRRQECPRLLAAASKIVALFLSAQSLEWVAWK